MKRLWFTAVFVCAFTSIGFAQRGGGGRGGGIGNFGWGGRGFDGVGRFGFGGNRFSRGFNNFNNFGFGGWLGYGGWGFPLVDDYYGYGGQQSPTVVVPVTINFPTPPPPPPPPPEPARLAVRTYVWADADASANQPANTFAIVTKDGAMRSAIAVWAEGSQLHFKAAEGGSGRVPLDAIDRAATLRINSQRGLKLSLP
jgi:hypothetical protein